jgi:hypothetical protein
MLESENRGSLWIPLLWSTLSVPLIILNVLGTVVAAIWLIYLSQWHVIGVGLLAYFGTMFLIGFALLPGTFFGKLAMTIGGRSPVSRATRFICVALAQLCYTAVITGWGALILYYGTRETTQSALLPVLILGHTVATGPWLGMLSKEDESVRYKSGLHVSLLSIGYIIACLNIWLGGAPILRALFVLLVTMAVSLLLQLVIYLTGSPNPPPTPH